MSNNLLKLDPRALTVGIVGYTGESGKALSKEILKNNIFKSTVLIGRRNVEYNESYYKNAVIIYSLLNYKKFLLLSIVNDGFFCLFIF
jgi:hypothetical protein